MERVIHIKPPVGVQVSLEYVLILQKAFHGLKQETRSWLPELASTDPCIFFYLFVTKMIMVEVFADDIPILVLVDHYIEYHFKIKNMALAKTMRSVNNSHT